MKLNKPRDVDKGWGSEEIWVSNEMYCGKMLHFNEGAKFSMHFHKDKDETWYVLSGDFQVNYIDTQNAKIKHSRLGPGDVWRNEPLLPHQLVCFKKGTIVEVSTHDSTYDNYRVMPGDSQVEDTSDWP